MERHFYRYAPGWEIRLENKIVIIGKDCIGRAIFQSLNVFFPSVVFIEDDKVETTSLDPFSVLILTPSLLPSPSCLTRYYHLLFGQNRVEWSLIIGVLHNDEDLRYLSENDVFGGNEKALMPNNIPGLDIVSLPLKLPLFLSKISQMERRIMDRYGYQQAKSSGRLANVLAALDNLNREIPEGEKIGRRYQKIEAELFSLDLQLLVSHRRYNQFRDHIVKAEKIEDKINIVKCTFS